MTSVADLYPQQVRRGYRRELLLLAICVVCFLVGLVMVTPVSRPGSVYQIQIFSPFCRSLLWLMLLLAAAGRPLRLPDLRPLLVQWSQPAAPLHLPVGGHRLDLRYHHHLCRHVPPTSPEFNFPFFTFPSSERPSNTGFIAPFFKRVEQRFSTGGSRPKRWLQSCF